MLFVQTLLFTPLVSSITKDHCVSFRLMAFRTKLVSLIINVLCDRLKVDSMADKFRVFCVGGAKSKKCHRENLFSLRVFKGNVSSDLARCL